MNDTTVNRGIMALSLRQLFLIVTFLAVGCAALKFADGFWSGVLTAVAAGAFMAALVYAAIDRDARQAFAIGFLICGGFYYGFLWLAAVQTSSGRYIQEYDVNNGMYPTTRLLRVIHQAVVTTVWVDATTGEELRDYDPNQAVAPVAPSGAYAGGSSPYGGTAAGGTTVISPPGAPLVYGSYANPNVAGVTRPQSRHFAVVGHRLLTLMIAYAGGLLARFVYLRRVRLCEKATAPA